MTTQIVTDIAVPLFFVFLLVVIFLKVFCRKSTKIQEDLIRFAFTFSNNTKVFGQNLMARITNTQNIGVSISPIDKKGAIAPVQDGSVAWASSDETVATVVVDPTNPLAATVTAVGVGVVQITVTADADLSEGVTTITGSGALEVVAGEAVGFQINFGTPAEQA